MPRSSQNPGLVITSIRGGMNDEDPAHILPDDQCVLIENAEFYDSTLGERRKGGEEVSIAGSSLATRENTTHLGVHFPELAEVYEAELFAISATDGVGVSINRRDKDGAWSTITPTDTPTSTFPEALRMASQTLHGKWFLAYSSAEDRMHVWDGTSLRRTGIIAATAAPTAVDTAGAGTFSGARLYRVRFIKRDGTVILLRSEPSPEFTFTPSGVNDGAVVTRPTPPGEGETHWELEASDGDGNFYVIATVAIGTTTATDTTEPSTDYADFELSEDIGDYALIPSVKYVKADQDRLIMAGSWTEAEKGSRVYWTPVWKDPGVGNDERLPADIDNFLDLDWMVGGELTGLSDPVNGAFYAFKWNRIYKLQRTGRVDEAYSAFLLSADRGALPGSIVSGTDEHGRGCIYFLDPAVGPMRVGAQGLQHINNLRGTWSTVNTKAENILATSCYYPDKFQVKWWVPTNGANSPNKILNLQVNELRTSSEGAGTSRGWSVATGKLAEAWCCVTFPEEITHEDTGAVFLSYRPYIGLPSTDYILRCDVGSTDNGQEYRAIIRTKPYILAGLLNRFGAMTAALLADPNEDPGVYINVRFIRDFGLEDNFTTTDFLPEQNETLVIKTFDNLVMSSAKAVQIEFSDA